MLNRYGREQAELRAFVDCLRSICEKPYRHQLDYADAIGDALQKNVVPASLLELCERVRDMSHAQSVAAQDADLPTMSQVFISIVSKLLDASTSRRREQEGDPYAALETEHTESDAAVDDDSRLHAHSRSRHTPYAEPVYRGFIDGV